MSIKSVMPSNHVILCQSLLLLPSIMSNIRVFQMSQFFTSDGQNFGVSASASVLPMNIQGSFPLAWTGWISLQSKGLSRVVDFSYTTVQKHQFFGTQLSSQSNCCPANRFISTISLDSVCVCVCVCVSLSVSSNSLQPHRL